MSNREQIQGLLSHTALFGEHKNITRSVVLLMLVAVLSVSIFSYGSQDIWFEALFVAAILIIVTIEFTRKRPFVISRETARLALPALMLGFYSFLQGTASLVLADLRTGVSWFPFAFDWISSVWNGIAVIALTVFGVFLLSFFRTNIRPLVMILVFVGNSFAFTGILRHILQLAYPNVVPFFFLSKLAPGQGFGTYLNQNHFALLMLMTLGLNMSLMLYKRHSKRRRLLFLLLSLCTWTALVLTSSRAGIVGSFIVLASLFLLPSRNESPSESVRSGKGIPFGARISLFAVLSVFLISGVVFIGQDRVTYRFSQLPSQLTKTTNASTFTRIDAFKATGKIIKDFPVFGIGFGSFEYAVSQYIDITGEKVPEQAHNDYLEFTASGGLTGAILAFCFFGILVFISRKRFRHSGYGFPAFGRNGAICGIAGIAFHSLFDFGLQFFANQLFFIALICLIVHDETDGRNSTGSREFFVLHRSQLTLVLGLILLLFSSITLAFGLNRVLLSRVYDGDRLYDPLFNGHLFPDFDPETHIARYLVAERARDDYAAVTSLNKAIALRPVDYVLWLDLAHLQDRLGMKERALGSYRRAVKLAPKYVLPKYELGYFLYKNGREKKAFDRFREVYRNDFRYFPDVVELAWNGSDFDGSRLTKMLEPMNAAESENLAVFLLGKKEYSALLDQGCNNKLISNTQRHNIVRSLLEKRQFDIAHRFQIQKCKQEPLPIAFLDGDFEDGEIGSGIGFGWRVIIPQKSIKIALDPDNPKKNKLSLRIKFEGKSNPNLRIVSQLLTIEKKSEHHVSFSYRTDNLVTAGTPVIRSILKGKASERVVSSLVLTRNANIWKRASFSFRARGNEEALEVFLTRTPCNQEICPIFGDIWLDDFRISRSF